MGFKGFATKTKNYIIEVITQVDNLKLLNNIIIVLAYFGPAQSELRC